MPKNSEESFALLHGCHAPPAVDAAKGPKRPERKGARGAAACHPPATSHQAL